MLVRKKFFCKKYFFFMLYKNPSHSTYRMCTDFVCCLSFLTDNDPIIDSKHSARALAWNFLPYSSIRLPLTAFLPCPTLISRNSRQRGLKQPLSYCTHWHKVQVVMVARALWSNPVWLQWTSPSEALIRISFRFKLIPLALTFWTDSLEWFSMSNIRIYLLYI